MCILSWFRQNRTDAASELNFSNPFELLVAVMLSAQCTDKRVNIVTPALFQAYPDAFGMAKASFDAVYNLVRSVSYPNAKTKHLIAMSQKMVEEFNGQVPSSMEMLQALPGVGRKTASVVMAVAFNQPAMPVDTHVFRVAHRMGLAPVSARTPLAVEQVLCKHIPQCEWSKAHHWLLLHGRYCCTARNPHCNSCELRPWCKTINCNQKGDNC